MRRILAVATAVALLGAAATTALLGAVPAAAVSGPGGDSGSGSRAGSGSEPAITLTTQNWGAAVSLLDSTRTAWAQGEYAEVSATIDLAGIPVHDWEARVDVVGSTLPVTDSTCRGQEQAAPKQLGCEVRVPISVGENRIRVVFTADGRQLGTATGQVTRAIVGIFAGYQVLDATGAWTTVARDQAVTLFATSPSALRYVVINAGTMPVRLTGACSGRTIRSSARLTCPIRGVRPAQSIAGEYEQKVQLAAPVGGGASIDIRAGIRAIAGTFSLSRAAVASGQPVVLTARGLPTDDAFGVQYRIDDEATSIGTSITRSGSIDYGFVLPSSVSPGPAHLNVEHDGITIASLPLRISSSPVPAPDAAGPPSGVLLLLLIPLAGLLAVLVLRRRPRTAPPRSDPPERPDPDPYPDATPAKPEPATARRS